MKILIVEKHGNFAHEGWHLKENESGFWARLDPDTLIEFKFPWKLYEYKILEEK